MDGLYGIATHQLDDKFRLRIPSKFFPKGENGEEIEDKSGTEFVFMAGSDGYIAVYPKEAGARRIAQIYAVPETSRAIHQAKRKLIGSIEPVVTDKQGRVVIPATLRGYARLGRDLISVGMDDHFEIWSKEEYEKQDLQMSFERAYSEVGFF